MAAAEALCPARLLHMRALVAVIDSLCLQTGAQSLFAVLAADSCGCSLVVRRAFDIRDSK